MPQVRQQAIRDIDAGGRDAAQRASKRHPRRRPVQAQAQGRIDRAACLPLRQRRRGIAQGAADPEVVANAGAIAPQRLARLDEPVHRHANRQRPARGVATHKRDVMVRGEREEPVQEPLDEPGRCIGQGQRQRAPRRRCAHRREVGEIHRQRLPADVGGRGLRREMHAAVERVHRHRQLHADRWLQQRGIVADAEQHVGAGRDAPADALDQVEFGDRAVHRRSVVQRGRAACDSLPRNASAALSSTPLT